MALNSLEQTNPAIKQQFLDVSLLSEVVPVGQRWSEKPANYNYFNFPTKDEVDSPHSEKITLDQICFVKALPNPSSIEQQTNGYLYLQTLATVTNGEQTRITNHTSINHLVTDNPGGNWGTSEVVVIMPGKDTFELNGVPENLTHYDTFWSGDIKIPPGSVIIWVSSMPEKYIGCKGYINIGLGLEEETKELKERIAALEKRIKSFPGVDALDKCMYIRNELIEYAHDKLDRIVKAVVEKMGYTYLPLENGRYSLHNNLDKQLIKLKEEYKIRTSVPHSDTYSGNMEMINIFLLGAMTNISNMNNNPNPEDDLDEVLHSYSYLANNVVYPHSKSEALSYFENLSDGDKNVRQIFASELFYWLKNNIEKIGNDRKIRRQLKLLFDIDPYLEELILQFSDKNLELNKHLNKL